MLTKSLSYGQVNRFLIVSSFGICSQDEFLWIDKKMPVNTAIVAGEKQK